MSAKRFEFPKNVGKRVVEGRRREDLAGIFEPGVGAIYVEDDKFSQDEKFADEYFFSKHRSQFTNVLTHGLFDMKTSDVVGIESQLRANVTSALTFWIDQRKRDKKPTTKKIKRWMNQRLQSVADELLETLTLFSGFRIRVCSLEVEAHTKDMHNQSLGVHVDETNPKRHLVITRTFYGPSTVVYGDTGGVVPPNGSTVAFWGGVGGTEHERPPLKLGERRFVAVIRLVPEDENG